MSERVLHWQPWGSIEPQAGPIAIAGNNFDPLTGEPLDHFVFWGCEWNNSYGWVSHDGRMVLKIIKPTHWMLLPPAPK